VINRRKLALNWINIAVCLAATWLTPATALGQEPERRPAEPVPIDSIPVDVTPTPRPTLPILSQIVTAESPPRWLPSLDGLYGFSILRYNRVSGIVPAWGLTLEATDPQTTPDLGGRIGIATTHQRAYWSGWAEQRLPVPGAVVVRYEHFQRQATFDDWRVPKRENDLDTFFAGNDLLDWWREKGYTVSVDAEATSGRYGGRATFLNASQHSERNRSPFALFDDDDYRNNPSVATGKLNSLTLSFRYDGRDVQSPLLPAPGWFVGGEWERGGGFIGGDIDFVRGAVDIRRYTRFGRDTWWDWQVLWLGALTDRGVPPQRLVRLGGPGSLRGFPTTAFVGEEGVQASTEVRFPLPVNRRIALIFLSWHLVGFADVGTVGDYERWHADVGVGISGINLFSYLGFFVAQRVTDLDLSNSDPRFIVRLRRDF
jgi:hypothetical protein